MGMVSVIIPTQNRPALLEEALQSVMNQTLPPAEIIVVDDGSKPAVDRDALAMKFGPTVRVLRNETAHGLAYSRNSGVEAATGEYVVHLDDDDLLSPETILEAHTLLQNDPKLDLVFLGVEGFGSRSAHFNKVQPEAVARVRAIGKGKEESPGLVYFGPELLQALLHTVPSAFQHVMLTRKKWNAVSALRWRAYQLDLAVPDNNAAKLCITGPLRDSEWAFYGGAIFQRTVLIDRPRYLARCDGQGYSSQPANRERHMFQGLLIKSQLFHAAQEFKELHPWKRDIRNSLASTQFDAAYHFFLLGNRGASWRHLWQALRLNPNPAYLRFALRMWLPRPSERESS